MGQDSVSGQAIDARPFLPSADNSPWTVAIAQRDEMASEIERSLSARNVIALVLKSQPGTYPVSLWIEAWTPADDRERAIDFRREALTISIEVNPYLHYPLIYHLYVKTTRREYRAKSFDLTADEAIQLALFALGLGPRPKTLPNGLERMATALIRTIPFVPPENPLIDDAKPRLITAPRILLIAAILLVFLEVAAEPGESALAILIALCLMITAAVIARKRENLFSVVKRPEVDPRSLILADSWHTSIPDVGSFFDALVQRVEQSVSVIDPKVRLAWENHHYKTPYGFEDRRRLTLTKGQAVVHIHLYPFANDAFVGWDGFLNLACWAETKPVSTSVRDGRRIEFRSLTVTTYHATDVDLVELNALCELVHRRMTIELKAFMKERQIDADIDFSIIRGDASGRIGQGQAGGTSPGRGGWRKLMGAA